MDPLTTATYQRLSGDAELVGTLATYNDFPAVFTDDRVPDDAAMPYVISSGNVAEEPWDDKLETGRRVTRDIGVYVDHRQTATVEAIAWRIRELFHRHRLNVDGYRTVIASVSGPIRISADDYDGRVLTVRFTLSEETADV